MGNTIDFRAMNDTELFLTLAGDKGIIEQAMLKKILNAYRRAHGGEIPPIGLSSIVKAYYDEGLDK